MLSSTVSGVARRLTSHCLTRTVACQTYGHKFENTTKTQCKYFSVLGHTHDIPYSQSLVNEVQHVELSSSSKVGQDFAVVKKAIPFTRSLNQNSLDGTVKSVDGDQVHIEFGKFKWICKRPENNKIKYKVGTHVRATKITSVDPSNSSILLIKANLDLTPDEVTRCSFPWKLSKLEKMLSFGAFAMLFTALAIYLCILYFVLAVMSVLILGVVLSPKDFTITLFDFKR